MQTLSKLRQAIQLRNRSALPSGDRLQVDANQISQSFLGQTAFGADVANAIRKRRAAGATMLSHVVVDDKPATIRRQRPTGSEAAMSIDARAKALTLWAVDRAIDKAAVGARIRALREMRGLSQQALGQEMGGASLTTVSRWERGEALPERRMVALCKALGVTAEHLLYGERPSLEGGRDVRTERIRKLLNGSMGTGLSEHEKEGLALALRDTEVDDEDIAAVIRLLYGRRKKRPTK